MADDEIAVTIVADEAANVEAAEAIEKQPEVKVEVEDPAKAEVKAQFDALTKRAEAADALRQRAEAAEAEAAKHRREAEESKKRETSSHLDTITTAISAANQEVETAKQAYKIARETGDINAEVEAADRLAIARADIRRLDEAKQDIEARKSAPRKDESAALDPVEAFARGRTAPTAQWVRNHPEYVRSERGMRKLTAADAIAQDEGFIPDTDEYFSRVEQYLGIGKTVSADEPRKVPTEAADVPHAKPRSAAPPVAPTAAVSSSGANGHGGQAVTLTRGEAAAATDGTHTWNYNDPKGKFKKGEPIGVQEFARRKLAMMRSGQYDRTFAEQ